MEHTGRGLGQRMAAEIRAEMARQELSGRMLAERVGKSHVTVGRWIKGTSPMDLDELDAVCQALGLTVPDLLKAVERNGGYDPAVLHGGGVLGRADTDQAPRGDSHRYSENLIAA